MGKSVLYLQQKFVRGGSLVNVWQMSHGPAFVHCLTWNPWPHCTHMGHSQILVLTPPTSPFVHPPTPSITSCQTSAAAHPTLGHVL